MSGRAIGFLACLVSVMVSSVARANDEERRRMNTISVNGNGKISAVPDLAIINVGVATQALTAQDCAGGQ